MPTLIKKPDLIQALQTASVRLEICLRRIEVCQNKVPGRHDVLVGEIPWWIDQTREQIRRAVRYCADIDELVALCRNDIFTDAPEYAERVTRIKNLLTVL